MQENLNLTGGRKAGEAQAQAQAVQVAPAQAAAAAAQPAVGLFEEDD